MKKKNILIIVSIFLMISLIYYFFANPNKNTNRVEVGVLQLTSSAPIFLAVEKGYFEAEGLDVNLQWFSSAQPVVLAVATNDLDVGATGITAGLYNILADSGKIKIVADKGREKKDFSSSFLMVTTNNFRKGVQDIKALQGKKIGITQAGSTFQYMIGNLLETDGLSLQEVEIVKLGKLSNIVSALKNGEIDAAILNEPTATKVENEGFAKKIVGVGDVIDYQVSAIFYGEKFIQNDEVALKFMKAYLKAVRDYHEIITNKDAKEFHTLIQILVKYIAESPEDISKSLPYISDEAELDLADIEKQIAWYEKEGLIKKGLKIEKVVNLEIRKKALK